MNVFYEGRVIYSFMCVLPDYLLEESGMLTSNRKPYQWPTMMKSQICIFSKGLRWVFWTVKFKIPWYKYKIKWRNMKKLKKFSCQTIYIFLCMYVKYLKGIYRYFFQNMVFLDFCHKIKRYVTWWSLHLQCNWIISIPLCSNKTGFIQAIKI
jgi:hypothetical protein